MANGKEAKGIEELARQLEEFNAARHQPPTAAARATGGQEAEEPGLMPVDELVEARFRIVSPNAKLYNVKPAEADWLAIPRGRELTEEERLRINELAERQGLPYRVVNYSRPQQQAGQAIFFFNKTHSERAKEELLRQLRGEKALETTAAKAGLPGGIEQMTASAYADAAQQHQPQPAPPTTAAGVNAPLNAETASPAPKTTTARPYELPTEEPSSGTELEIATLQTIVTVYERQQHLFKSPALINGILAAIGIDGYRISAEDPSQVVFTGSEYLAVPNASAMQGKAVSGLLAMEKRIILSTAGELERLVKEAAEAKGTKAAEARQTLSSYLTEVLR